MYTLKRAEAKAIESLRRMRIMETFWTLDKSLNARFMYMNTQALKAKKDGFHDLSKWCASINSIVVVGLDKQSLDGLKQLKKKKKVSFCLTEEAKKLF